MSKAQINPPELAVEDPRYRRDCHLALEPSFQSLLLIGAKAGWAPKDIAYTLLVMAADTYREYARDEVPLAPRM
jgi:hypothetical protein